MNSRWTEEDLARAQAQHQHKSAKPSKYRNVKVQMDGYVFDSKHEAQRYAELKLREKAGEISQLQLQVPFNLITVNEWRPEERLIVARYVADFVFYENGVRIIEDTKGHRTKEYLLKKRWMELQEGITIREVYARKS